MRKAHSVGDGQTHTHPSPKACSPRLHLLPPPRAVTSAARLRLGLRFASRGSAVLFSVSSALLALPAGTHALPVAHDAGRGAPISQHLASILAPADDLDQGAGVHFPIRTPTLKVGVLRQPRTFPDHQWLTQPVFIVGGDEVSRRWLLQHRPALLRIRAAGIVVQASTREVYSALQREAEGLSLAPAQVPWLASRLNALGAAVYPIVIMADGRILPQPPTEARP